VRGALNCASCACASNARALASAIAALDASASAERRAVSSFRMAIRSNAAVVSLFALAISVFAADSYTLPETTIPYVATTPTMSAPINIQLDQNEMNSAKGSDIGMVRAPLLLSLICILFT